MLNVAYRECAKRSPKVANGEHFRWQPAADRAESAQALFGRHRDQPYGGAETCSIISRGMAWSRCARWHRADRSSGALEITAPPHALDLARAAQQRDDRGRTAAIARLAPETGVHLGGTAAPHLYHAVADRPDGRDYRDQQHLGIVPQARGHGHSAWPRYRSIRAAGRPRGGVRANRIAG